MDNKESKKPEKPLKHVAVLSGIAVQMFSVIALGTFLGVNLDEKFPNKKNLYTIFLSLTSVIFAIVFVIRRIIADSKEIK